MRQLTINHPTNSGYRTRYLVILLDASTGRKWLIARTMRNTRSSLWNYAAENAQHIASIAGCPAEKITGKNEGKAGYYAIHFNQRPGLMMQFHGTEREHHGETFEIFEGKVTL
jgi:hypothetical protein